MADDPIIKFFRQDLTEEEEQALLKALSSSEEEALRFGQHAEASYYHYGLPEPEWKGGGPPKGFYPKSKLGLTLWVSLALTAGLAAYLGWKWHKDGTLSFLQKASAVSEQTNPGSVSNPSEPASGDQSIAGEKAPRKEAVLAHSQKGNSPKPNLSTQNPPGSSAPAMNGSAPARHSYSNLEVVVHQSKPGPVVVQILDPNGSPTVLLYQGMLQPGSWTFDWNGRLGNGEIAPSGTYQFQVVSGAVTLSKKVVIQK